MHNHRMPVISAEDGCGEVGQSNIWGERSRKYCWRGLAENPYELGGERTSHVMADLYVVDMDHTTNTRYTSKLDI